MQLIITIHLYCNFFHLFPWLRRERMHLLITTFLNLEYRARTFLVCYGASKLIDDWSTCSGFLILFMEVINDVFLYKFKLICIWSQHIEYLLKKHLMMLRYSIRIISNVLFDNMRTLILKLINENLSRQM